ncbi:CRISPR-associated endonuclease Cas2 [Candidatus Roizmanbacteria bacterium]|nr:CRISPR-associated endonuclease Cas2 [Candidatus Roizmanbacteria bacterium]
MSNKKVLSQTASKSDSFKHGELRQAVLSSVGLAILLGGTFLVTPNFPIIFSSVVGLIQELTKKKIPQSKIKRVLKNLEKKEIIYLQEKDGEVYVNLKGTFTPIILKYSLQPLLELKKKKKKWDGKWFLVFFDVPETQRNKRDYLRNFLRDIGFYPYQQSVYIFPYECEKEIALIKKIVEGAKYTSYIIAEKIENEKTVKTYFGLS